MLLSTRGPSKLTRSQPEGPHGRAWPDPSPVWPEPKPRPGQISGNLRIQEPGNLQIWDPTKIKKTRILKIQMHVGQNVGSVWISTVGKPPGSVWCHFICFPWIGEKINRMCSPIFLGGPIGIYGTDNFLRVSWHQALSKHQASRQQLIALVLLCTEATQHSPC